MAGTGWNFLIEHDGNADTLMPAIQTQVFQSGRFEIPIIEPEFLDELEFFSASDEERLAMADQYGLRPMLAIAERVGLDNFVPWCVARIRDRRVGSFEELRAMQCLSSSGTHSPLDLYGISDSPKDFRLFPLRGEQIVKVFGKTRVELADVSSMKMFVYRSIPTAYARWQGVFVPVYTGDRITHAYIEGASGD